MKVSSSAVTKTIKRYDETVSHEDHHRKGRPRVTSAAEDKLIRVTILRNQQLTAPQIAPQRVQITDTSQHQLFRGDCMNQAFMVELLQRTTKGHQKKKRLVWDKKHEQWTLDQWKCVLWSDESKFAIFDSNLGVFCEMRSG